VPVHDQLAEWVHGQQTAVNAGPGRPRRSPVASPFVRRRRLVTELRTLREQSGMTADEPAGRILRILGVPGEKFDEILQIACDASDRGWCVCLSPALVV
jgi:hypothetical protein